MPPAVMEWESSSVHRCPKTWTSRAGANSGASGGSAAAVDPAADQAALPQPPGCCHQSTAVMGGSRWRIHGSPAVSGLVPAPPGCPAHPVEGFLAPGHPRHCMSEDHQGKHAPHLLADAQLQAAGIQCCASSALLLFLSRSLCTVLAACAMGYMRLAI